MKIRLSDLPPELRQRVLEQTGLKPATLQLRRANRPPSRLMKVCSCRCEIFRPDGDYPETCDGCGRKRS